MFFLTLISHTQATHISTLLLCQGSCLLGHVQEVRSLRCATTFPCIRALLRAAVRTKIQIGYAWQNAILPRFIGHYLMCPQHRNARRARSCIVVHFTCPLVALRFEGTFHVFTNFLVKTFHFCADNIRSHTARSYPRKNFTSEAARHVVAYRYCRAAQDIKKGAAFADAP